MKGLRFIGLLAAAAVLGLAPARAQQQPQPAPKQEESLAEAARRARAQRKVTPATEKVWTNETLPSSSIGVSDVGSAGEGGAPGDTGAQGASLEQERDRARAENAVREEKAKFERLKSDLSLLQRDYDLQRQQFYSNPGQASDTAGQRRLSEQEAQVEAKKLQVTESEQRLASLELALKQVNQQLGPKPQPQLTPEQQQSQWSQKLQPLQAELAQVEAEIARMQQQFQTSPSASAGSGNDFTRNQIRNLETKRDDLRRKITDIQDEARRSGAPAGWVRP